MALDSVEKPVMMMTGRSALNRLASRITVRPSIPGILRSAISRSYGYTRMRSSAERPSGATSTSYSASASVFASRSRMLASSSTTRTRGLVVPLAGRAGAGAAAEREPPRRRWLSSQASMSRLRKRHWRPTRTAGILPALISRYTVRRLTWRYSRTSSVVRNVSSIMRQRPDRRRGRQFYGEHGAPFGVVGGDYLAAVFLDDAVGD